MNKPYRSTTTLLRPSALGQSFDQGFQNYKFSAAPINNKNIELPLDLANLLNAPPSTYSNKRSRPDVSKVLMGAGKVTDARQPTGMQHDLTTLQNQVPAPVTISEKPLDTVLHPPGLTVDSSYADSTDTSNPGSRNSVDNNNSVYHAPGVLTPSQIARNDIVHPPQNVVIEPVIRRASDAQIDDTQQIISDTVRHWFRSFVNSTLDGAPQQNLEMAEVTSNTSHQARLFDVRNQTAGSTINPNDLINRQEIFDIEGGVSPPQYGIVESIHHTREVEKAVRLWNGFLDNIERYGFAENATQITLSNVRTPDDLRTTVANDQFTAEVHYHGAHEDSRNAMIAVRERAIQLANRLQTEMSKTPPMDTERTANLNVLLNATENVLTLQQVSERPTPDVAIVSPSGAHIIKVENGQISENDRLKIPESHAVKIETPEERRAKLAEAASKRSSNRFKRFPNRPNIFKPPSSSSSSQRSPTTEDSEEIVATDVSKSTAIRKFIPGIYNATPRQRARMNAAPSQNYTTPPLPSSSSHTPPTRITPSREVRKNTATYTELTSSESSTSEGRRKQAKTRGKKKL